MNAFLACFFRDANQWKDIIFLISSESQVEIPTSSSFPQERPSRERKTDQIQEITIRDGEKEKARKIFPSHTICSHPL